MKILNWSSLDEGERISALARPAARTDENLQQDVRAILGDVRALGWAALCDHALKIDGAEPRKVAVKAAAAEARARISADQLEALIMAANNIRLFHARSLPPDHQVETMTGLTVRKMWRPIDRIGLYVPGGKTPLFSTLLMLGLPARAARVGEIVVVTPPRADGGLDPFIALAAEMCGIEAVWTVGGAQAIAALAFGAGEIPRVDKICGPGNAWVSEAKSQVSAMAGGPAIDMPAGPSELMVIADGKASAGSVTADLLSQAEHDRSAQVLLVTPSRALAEAVEQEARTNVASLPRAEIARSSLGNARMIVCADLIEAVEIANAYAPEHLALAVDDPDALLDLVRNAGAVFCGGFAAETFGDYLAGSSHVLPTDGAARSSSGVSVYTFLKSISVQRVSRAAARLMASPAATLARMEGLEAHARAAEARLEEALS